MWKSSTSTLSLRISSAMAVDTWTSAGGPGVREEHAVRIVSTRGKNSFHFKYVKYTCKTGSFLL